jgi:undecaprenyl-diphosphatase
MSYLEAIFLGILQGLTEFLPISSSGHLVLAQQLFGIESAIGLSGPIFELMLHAGTLLAVMIYFWRQLWAMLLSLFQRDRSHERERILKLGLAMIPAVLAYVFFEEQFEAAYRSPLLASVMLVVTGVLLLLPRLLRRSGEGGTEEVTWLQAAVMGVGQAIAILPGISRSGSTIVAGMLCGAKPARAAEFSFLLAVPAILGALVVKAGDFGQIRASDLGPYLAGTAAAFVFGVLAVYGVLASIRRGKFEYFGYYCMVVGIAAFIYFKQVSS